MGLKRAKLREKIRKEEFKLKMESRFKLSNDKILKKLLKYRKRMDDL